MHADIAIVNHVNKKLGLTEIKTIVEMNEEEDANDHFWDIQGEWKDEPKPDMADITTRKRSPVSIAGGMGGALYSEFGQDYTDFKNCMRPIRYEFKP